MRVAGNTARRCPSFANGLTIRGDCSGKLRHMLIYGSLPRRLVVQVRFVTHGDFRPPVLMERISQDAARVL